MILHKCPCRLASARAGCLLDGGGFDGYVLIRMNTYHNAPQKTADYDKNRRLSATIAFKLLFILNSL